ncbi:hypothetical protein L226DRAFT_538729 [Lentinus tigrinus ALCF2SS1-7]|nr:hypothetical protein L226DRAFT_538729 [Lentinus tigrinus ALCF2SS1-7]
MMSAPSTPMTINTFNNSPRQSEFFAHKSSATYTTSMIPGIRPISRNSMVVSTSARRPLPPVPAEGSQQHSALLKGDTREDDEESLPAYAP